MSIRHPYDEAVSALVYSTPANPAAGDHYVILVPQNARIEIVAAYFLFTTAVAVADRIVYIYHAVGGVPVFPFWAPRVQIASTSVDYAFGRGITREPGVAPIPLHYQAPLGDGIILDNTQAINVDVLNMQAADHLTDLHLWYRYWYTGVLPA